MERIDLTAKELLFLAAAQGVQTFFGLPDPFFGMDDHGIRQEVTQLQLALEKKGYASLDFEDNFILTPMVAQVVTVCAHCERYISADYLAPAQSPKRLLCYFHKDQIVIAEQDNDKVILERVECADAITRLHEPLKTTGELEWCPPCLISFDLLKQAKAESEHNTAQAQSLLEQQGCNPEVAALIVEGFSGKAGYASIMAVDLESRNLESVICITAPNGTIVFTPDEQQVDHWQISVVSFVQLVEAVARLCRVSQPQKEGG